MASSRGGLLLLLLAALAGRAAPLTVAAVLTVASAAKEIVKGLETAGDLLRQHVDLPEVGLPFLQKAEVDLVQQFAEITRKLDRIEGGVEAIGATAIHTALENLPDRMKLELRVRDLMDLITKMDVSYKRFQEYTLHQKYIERLTLEDYAKKMISHDPESAVSLLERIHSFVVPNRGITDMGLFKLVKKSLEVQGDMLCNAKQSPQQVLYNLYNTIALTELKGYAMIQFSYMLLRMYEAGNFTKESQLVRERFESRTEKGIEMISSVMKNASRSLSMCTPRSHSPGDTYLEITEFLQGYIQNEVDLNRDGTCTKTCSDYPLTKSFGCYMNFNYACQQRRCNGNILNCKFIKSDMRVCPSRHNQYRYEYIKYSNGRVLGRDEGCQFGSTEVDSWWRWIFYHCSYCFCICDEQGPYSDRYFSLRPVIANIQNNMVVTGLRFVKRNRIIHLQIQEGQLLPDGNINSTTVHWVEPNAFKITDKKVYKGQDYHTLDISKKAVDLDDLEAEDGYVVTGVRFKLLGGHLNFEIYTTKFDFATGKLVDPSNTGWWRDNINTPEASSNKRREIKIENLDRPIRSDRPFNQISKHDQYLEFTHTGMDQDASQTTVPFIDAQPVESLQPVPLAGAGIFYKGNDKFAGFIAPKIITYDFSKHMQAAFPEPQVH